MSLFWGIKLQPNAKMVQVKSLHYHISGACIDSGSMAKVYLTTNSNSYLLANLDKTCRQRSLDLVVGYEDDAMFSITGDATVSLTGYHFTSRDISEGYEIECAYEESVEDPLDQDTGIEIKMLKNAPNEAEEDNIEMNMPKTGIIEADEESEEIMPTPDKKPKHKKKSKAQKKASNE